MTDFDLARKTMVDNQLRTAGVTDRRLLAALGAVPREKFVPELRRPLAYTDAVLPLHGTRKLGAPAPLAKLLQLAAIEGSDKVLVLGTGTGYSAALLARLADSVVAVESDGALAAAARTTLGELGVANATIVEGALESAGKSKGPYDVIVIEGALAEVPDTLLNQLKPEGRLVALIGRDGKPAVAHLFVRTGKGIAARAEFNANLPPLPGAAPREDSFVF
ncbi:MAG: protein-L-isoaspartate O-methyltransferase [Hyphomicrobiales bacterium]|nr:MAG: protein-L-isoaspartate O-methyltransferase [Hyphomicrobiales bacterium]